jgi:hypothetical protein
MRMRFATGFRTAVLLALVIALATPRTHGQELLDQAFGSARWEAFGTSIVAHGPDLNGDGFAEIAVGAKIEQSGTQWNLGAATVLSGRDLTPIHTFQGTNSYDYLGASLAWCDDLDGDGLSDLVVGSPGATIAGLLHSGKVEIYSTGTWTLLREFDGGYLGGSFGISLSTLRDVDGDGVAELLVGAVNETSAAGTTGAVYVYSGASGALLRRITVIPSNLLGLSVADVGDVNGDGVNDIGAGAPNTAYPYPYYVHAGTAYVFSGADGSLLHQWHGDSKRYYSSGYLYYIGNFFGRFIGPAGDVDGDGTPDVWVSTEQGIPNYGSNVRPAFIAIYSGATGAKIRKINTVTRQYAADAVGDLDGDGISDFAVGGTIQFGVYIITYHDSVLLLSGADGRELWRGERPDHSTNWGSVIKGSGDVNGDGIPDFAVGAYYDSTVDIHAGRLDLLGGSELWLDVQHTHFPTAGNTLTLTAAEGPPGNLVGLFLTGVNGAPTFTLLALSTFDAIGQAQWSGTVPKGYAGTSLALRALAIGKTGRLVESVDETISFQ